MLEVVTTTLEMRSPDELRPASRRPQHIDIVATGTLTPEFARFLYALVGGPWTWTGRIGWSREQWEADLQEPGTGFWVAYAEGAPVGYVQLGAQVVGDRTEVEIKYFGITEQVFGLGLGGWLLETAIREAWATDQRCGLPAVSRVWVHTCSLDGPVAVGNYQARGLRTVDVVATQEDVPAEPLGTWRSTTGLPR